MTRYAPTPLRLSPVREGKSTNAAASAGASEAFTA